MTLQVDHHGGCCCGMKHLYNFGEEDEFNIEDIRDILQRLGLYGRAVEVILNEDQLDENPTALQALADLGFVLDLCWHNENSGNACFRFTKADRRYRFDNVAQWNGMISDARLQGSLPQITDQTTPFRHTLVGGEPFPVPAPPADEEFPTAVLQTYHCVFRNGNRGAGYDTITLARENLGRRTRIDMRTIYSDGSIVWSENYYNV